jgi:hypothetical protein
MGYVGPVDQEPTLPGIRLGVVRGISYGLFGRPDAFVAPARALGAGLVRVYLYWSQVQPRRGEYRWETVDAILDQYDESVELWLTVCSSSPWASQVATDFLPPSPALDQGVYGEFVRRLVERCAGRVRYWQCDNEVSNAGLLWAGTAAEYVTQLSTMYGAVRVADPTALVVLGGCGYDMLSGGAAETTARAFFDHVCAQGRDYFDLFAVNLYGDPYRVPEFIATARELMARHGYAKPIVAGEHGGPVPFEFPEAEAAMGAAFAEAFAGPPPELSTDALQEQAATGTPEKRALTTLYDRAAELPPRLRMFLEGCPPELEQRRHRINCRQLVMRTVAGLAEGVARLAYWNLAPEIPMKLDPRQFTHLMFGKLILLEYDGDALGVRRPAATTFALLAEALTGARSVRPLDVDDPRGLSVYVADRGERGPLLVAWDRRDPFGGEDQPPISVSLPWAGASVAVVDAFGADQPADLHEGRVALSLCGTPVFVTT